MDVKVRRRRWLIIANIITMKLWDASVGHSLCASKSLIASLGCFLLSMQQEGSVLSYLPSWLAFRPAQSEFLVTLIERILAPRQQRRQQLTDTNTNNKFR